jgi:hypothetical protein
MARAPRGQIVGAPLAGALAAYPIRAFGTIRPARVRCVPRVSSALRHHHPQRQGVKTSPLCADVPRASSPSPPAAHGGALTLRAIRRHYSLRFACSTMAFEPQRGETYQPRAAPWAPASRHQTSPLCAGRRASCVLSTHHRHTTAMPLPQHQRARSPPLQFFSAALACRHLLRTVW